MSKNYWLKQEEKFFNAVTDVKIPNRKLNKVPFSVIKKISDLDKIPQGGGCYWIWTNEPVLHTFHPNKIPKRIDNGEIIYNGIAKRNVRGRIQHHLFGEPDAGWSGISLDLYLKNTKSHRKKYLGITGKVPYYNGEKIRTKELLNKLNFSDPEKKYIEDNDLGNYFFRNGININDNKHKDFDFKVYYVTGLKTVYAVFIETEWRERYNTPKLCSYKSGR